MGVPEASLPFHAEDENLPKKTSSSWKRKGSSHLSSFAAPDSATSAGCGLVTSRNNLHSQLQAAQAQAEVCGHESPTRRARNWNETAKGNLPSITGFLRTDFFPKEKMLLVVYENIALYFLLNSWLQK